jgi:uncharacterized protein
MKPFVPRALLVIGFLIAVAAQPLRVAAQDFGFEPPASADDDALPDAMRDLAGRVVPVYMDDDSDRYLANLSALQLVLGDPAAAHATRLSLQERVQSERGTLPRGPALVYDIYTQARSIETSENVPFVDAYAQAFGATLSGLDDLDAYELENWFVAPTEPLRATLDDALERQRGKSSIALAEALELVRAWFAFEAYRSFGSLARGLLAEDKERRYVIDEDLAIPVAQDATIAVTVVRPRKATSPGSLPTLLEFTLDRSSRDPREAAAHGYVSVRALTRIAGDPTFRPRAPFESEGDDARAVIEWITQQSWSDGRVGMQGTGYGGFVAWSAAKLRPTALRAIATSDPVAPGIDVPMSNGIVHNSAYRWVYGLLAAPDDGAARDTARWRTIDEDWFQSGRSYREFPMLPGRASAVFRSWLNHPSYDRFWQKWLPFGDELAKIDIPVLTVTGYYSAGETAALYYFTEHRRHDPQADHALLIGPFEERSVERGASSSVRELAVDAAAQIEPNGARYQWFDYALASAERPALLRDAVNYQLAGANEWRHESSLEALEEKTLRFYLEAGSGAGPHTLAPAKPPATMSLVQTLDLRDRADGEWRPARQLVLGDLPAYESAVFVTAPIGEPVDLAGRLRGVLDFTINKYDVDLVMSLYELRADGTYVKLFDPAYAFRASYARDRVRRRLLMNGVRQQLPFQSERMFGRRIEAGSRLVLTLAINKRADQQINYGGTHDVSEQSIEDAGAPIRIIWHDGSFIEVPAR